MAEPKLKFALTGFPERYSLPSRPSKAAPAVLDTHRQTRFLLSDELTLFEQAMNAQLEIVSANRKKRDPHTAILFAYWSRVFCNLSDACSAACLGSYASCSPLLRAACDCLAVQRALIEDEFADSDRWVASGISRAKEENALAIDLGRFRAASVMAADETLGRLYRIVTELTMPSFGPTMLQSGPDTNLRLSSIGFGEGSFHLAWAELSLGWLLTLASAQLETAARCQLFTIDERLRGEIEQIAEGVEAAHESSRRCYVEERDGGGFLLHNYRRTAAGQPKRVLLR